MPRRAGILGSIAEWWEKRGLRAQVRAAMVSSRTKGLVSGRPTRNAGLASIWESQYNLIGRSYGSYRDVLETIKRIRDYNPDAALAVWNTLRLCNPGHEVYVYSNQAGPEGQPVEDQQGKAMIEELASRVGEEYGGGMDTLLDVLNLTLMTQGAIAAEVALDQSLREIEDFYPVDPRYIDFVHDAETGKAVPVIAALGEPVRLNLNQFRYIPLDPDVDDPHGRSPLWTTLEIIFFQQQVMRDLQAVMHNQGYPRMDVSALEEIVVQNTPEHLKTPGREEEFRTWVDGYLSDLQTTYNSLNPDDTFIHWDWVKVGYVGATNGTGSVDVARVIQVIDTQMVSALKQLPVLLGRNEGATTTHATVQWQIYIAGIEALQRRTKRMVEWLYDTALRVYGRQSYTVVEFDPIRKVDRKAEAEAEKLETETLIQKVQAGWMENDEAAMESVGHEAVGPMVAVSRQQAAGSTSPRPSPGQEEEPEEGEEEPEDEEERTRAAREPIVGGVAAQAPEGVPEWLWERARETGAAYQGWAQRTFEEKMGKYLAGSSEQSAVSEKRSGGNGDGHGPR